MTTLRATRRILPPFLNVLAAGLVLGGYRWPAATCLGLSLVLVLVNVELGR